MNEEKTSFWKKDSVRSVIASLLSILIGLLAGTLLILIVGCTNKSLGFQSAWEGIRLVFFGLFSTGRDATGALTFGFNPASMGNMLFRAMPLILTGLSVATAFKTGLFNIGAPGQYLMGTMASLMIAGAGAAFAQYFNIGNEIGRIIMTVMVLVTGLLGMRKTVDVIGSLGPCIIVFVVLIAAIALTNGATGLEAGNEYVKSHNLLKPSENWLWAAVMYFSYCILFQAAYLSGVASTNPATTRQLVQSVVIGAVIYVLASILMMLAFIANISILEGIEVPNLYLGGMINPFLGAIYGIILLAALYTTTAPLVWSVTNVFAAEKTKAYPWVVVAVSVLAYFGSGFSSFSVLVNLVTTVAAYVGILYIVPVFYIKFVKKPKPAENA